MLSSETILNNLPCLAFRDKRHLPKEQGVYFLLISGELAYIGASKCIHSRLADICGHPINLCLRKQVAEVLSITHDVDVKWINYAHDEYKQMWLEHWERFKRETTVAWLLLPTTRLDLFAIEAALIEQHNPRLNSSRQAVFLNTSNNTHCSI